MKIFNPESYFYPRKSWKTLLFSFLFFVIFLLIVFTDNYTKARPVEVTILNYETSSDDSHLEILASNKEWGIFYFKTNRASFQYPDIDIKKRQYSFYLTERDFHPVFWKDIVYVYGKIGTVVIFIIFLLTYSCIISNKKEEAEKKKKREQKRVGRVMLIRIDSYTNPPRALLEIKETAKEDIFYGFIYKGRDIGFSEGDMMEFWTSEDEYNSVNRYIVEQEYNKDKTTSMKRYYIRFYEIEKFRIIGYQDC